MSEFDQDLEIDLHALDVEWKNQAVLYRKYCDSWAEAKGKVDSLKSRLDRMFASLFIKVKENPSAFTDGKVTEELAKSLVITQPEYVKLQKKYNEALEEFSLMYSAKSAFEQRKTALEYLTKLFLSNYWAEVRVSSEDREDYEDYKVNEAKRDFAKSMKRRSLRKNKEES